MNILREVRRVRQKSMPVRIILLLLFSVIFIVTTYAWVSTQADVSTKGLKGNVTSWDISYYVKADEDENESEMLDQTVVFEIDDLYPGMPNREDVVRIYNIGEASTNINYDLVSVKVFGREVLKKNASGQLFLDVYEENQDGEDVVVGEVGIETDTKPIKIFSGDTNYPFNISYTYDKTKLIGTYIDDETTPNAAARFTFNVNWPYNGTSDKDALDTQFGKEAYEFYEDGNDTQKAIEITLKITSSMIHPDNDPDYVE